VGSTTIKVVYDDGVASEIAYIDIDIE